MTGRRAYGLLGGGAGLAGVGLIGAGLAFPLAEPAMSGPPLRPPSADFWLGTNALGQDLLTCVLVAAPGTMSLGLAAGVATVGVALLVAFAAVVLPPGIGRLILRGVDTLMALPALVPAMLVASLLRPGPGVLLLLLVAFAWPFQVRALAALMRRERSRESYRLARGFGAGAGYLLRRHLVPRMLPVLVALTIQDVRRAVMHAAGLAFLGLADPTVPNWGAMLAQALPLLHDPSALWLILAPAGALSLFIFSLFQIGLRLERWSHHALGGRLDPR
ncbi:ABC transporter permease [Pararhodospirillum oryzae]|uniref:ABC transporter permease n=1 Tax=Pararhodospirillum oryzae TaxID=478448 RepID=A0A512HB68_9PROT|nr:ABC transporter permease subunit [Pararhodospirillum oryzae]GEO82688.1 ABC transporter permease [Pararhodospirillum oryzae]